MSNIKTDLDEVSTTGGIMRVGIVVNPDAGLGGRLGFKGSDGRAKEAREGVLKIEQGQECNNA